jgi:ATP-dependent protease ClpP protease subunit
MNIVLEGPINADSLTELVKAYNDLEEKGGQLHIFFNSEGGEVTSGEAMVELINRYAEVSTLTIYGLIASMGFVIAAKTKCKKIVLDTAYAIVHLSRWTTRILEGGKPLDEFARFQEKNMKKTLGKSTKFYEELGFNEDELTELKAGKDLFLDSTRLKKIIK